MKSITKAFLCFLFVFTFSCRDKVKEGNSAQESVEESVEEPVEEGTTDMNFEVEDAYRCPMDCEDGKEYDEEGACPVCGMALKHVDEEAHDDSENHEEHKNEEHDLPQGRTTQDLE